jgi:hypothetical protein
MTKLLTCLLASLGTSEPPPAAASDPEPTEDPLVGLLVVRFEVEGGGSVEAALHAELLAALRDAGVVAELSGDAPLEVVVAMDGETVGSYAVVYQHRGVLLDSWSCPCTGDELRARLRRATIVAWHAAARETGSSAPEPVPAAEVEPAAVSRSTVRRQRGFASWVAGIATTAVGTSIVTSTSALLISDAAAGRKVEPVAIGLWSGGIAMMAAGAVLWGIGRHRRATPMASVRTGGLGRSVVFVVEGRF